ALWVALEGELRRYPSESPEEEDPFVRLPAVGLTELVPDGLGGVWTVREGQLARYDSEGEILATTAPFAAPRQAQRVAADPATVGVWSSDGESLVRLTAAGFEQERHVLGSGLEIRDQSAVPAAPETDPPQISIVSPAAEAVLADDQPPIEIAWSDLGSGVDPKSLVLTLDGVTLEVECSTSLSGATCEPDLYLEPGAHSVTATVTDQLANAAVPASVSFTIDLYSNDPVPDPGSAPGSGPAPYQPIAVDRGIGANAVYVTDEAIEAISPATGNLTLSIPLGQTYSVGPLISYSFQAVYNSSIWQRAELECNRSGVSCPPGSAGQSVTFSVPNPASNAGLGWEIHFGRLFSVQPPTGLTGLDLELWPAKSLAQSDLRAKWLYVAPDGATHALGNLTDRPGGTSVSYSLDGTQLRLRQVSDSSVEVDLPNGVIVRFERADTVDGTLFCAGSVTGCWRFKEQEDPYEHKMWVTYPGASSGVETWEVHDSLGRFHELTFDRSAGFRAGGDGAGIDLRANGDELGDMRRLITKLDLEAFGGSRAVYFFDYGPAEEVARGGHYDGGAVSVTAQRLRTRLLSQIRVPGLQPWKFTSSTVANPGESGFGTGVVLEVTLPSRGKLSYLYGGWSFPTRCDYRTSDPPILPPTTYEQLGVVRKLRLRPGGSEEGRWIYQSFLDGGHPWDPNGPDCSLARWRRTEVRGPKVGGKYVQQVFYHAVAEGPRIPSELQALTSWQVSDHGLPYTKEISTTDSTGQPVFLSREVYDCPAVGDCTAAHKKRSIYVRYASEWTGPCQKQVGHGPECWSRGAERVVERTVYHDDGGRWMERRFEDYNGLGSAGLIKTLSNFSQAYEETTEYDVGHAGLPVDPHGYFDVGSPTSWTPAATAKWVLHPYSFKITKDGGLTYRSDYEFNESGTLTCERRRKVDTGRKKQDLVTRFVLGAVTGVNRGLPVLEEHYGGDDGALGPELCSAVGSVVNGTKFTVEHTYQSLVRASTRVGGSGFPYTYKAMIDASTSLPSVTFDVAEVPTTLAYDVLGRLVRATPSTALGEASTVLTHHNPGNQNPWVTIERKDGTVVVSSTELQFDHFGRPRETRVRRPLPGGGWSWSKRQTLYDAAGRLYVETTLQDANSHTTLNRTLYKKYDAFGHATEINAPDRQVVRMFYFGDRKVERRAGVATSEASTEVVTTSTFYDALGRVVEEEGPLFRTVYDVDPYGQVIRATRWSGTASQVRTYGWDGRGLLTSEVLPEIGADGTGPGTITYRYDAMGHSIERWDGRVRLKTSYDVAGRPVSQSEGSRLWQEWEWGVCAVSSTFGTNHCWGKLVEARRHNYPTGSSTDDWRVSESYEYRGRLGQLSRRTTKLEFPFDPPGQQLGDEFETSWSYNSLGHRASLTYPRCTGGQCSDGGDSPGPVHTVSSGYNSGVLTGLSTNLGVGVSYEYHPNLNRSKATYSHTMYTLWAMEPHGMTRPQRIRVARGGDLIQFDTGTYTYDPSGNIKAIGSEHYVYDRASRLLKGTVVRATG
ncbi:MAG: RHS repeat protein, partial [Acidobacteria bacterium]|nr:RHS repeat protein [Acidobacteriota bacterium]